MECEKTFWVSDFQYMLSMFFQNNNFSDAISLKQMKNRCDYKITKQCVVLHQNTSIFFFNLEYIN